VNLIKLIKAMRRPQLTTNISAQKSENWKNPPTNTDAIFGQVGKDLVCINICVTFMNCILNFAQSELLGKLRGELQN
jgi:hypothetical protein